MHVDQPAAAGLPAAGRTWRRPAVAQVADALDDHAVVRREAVGAEQPGQRFEVLAGVQSLYSQE